MFHFRHQGVMLNVPMAEEGFHNFWRKTSFKCFLFMGSTQITFPVQSLIVLSAVLCEGSGAEPKQAADLGQIGLRCRPGS